VQKEADMPEAVRLVVWDLDETFWHGTVTEGGIKAYIQEHHDVVVDLARRGIMSSICSKNSPETIIPILEEKGIRDYFIFPSISWEPKGARLAALIEAVQLRAPTIMFIDDNPNNLAEAQASVPGIQVERETFIPSLLSDPRFKGKDDFKLSRLAQYKMLESKKRDEVSAKGDNHAFLRNCDVRVLIEWDVESHIDRAVELINRTNQLNFTKSRLPEDPEQARDLLRRQMSNPAAQAGLVHVVDKYGDYGFIGFFLLQAGRNQTSADTAAQTLQHFCFSCRTLGMLVEQWVYEWLRKPQLQVVGEVLTDLSMVRSIDWVRQVSSLNGKADASNHRVAPQVRLHGGCEIQALSHYFGEFAGAVTVNGNFGAGRLFVRVNSASLLLSALDRVNPDFEEEAHRLALPYDLLISSYFSNAPEGSVFVFSGAMDALVHAPRYRHREHGWEIRLEPSGFPTSFDLIQSSAEDLQARIDSANYQPAAKEQVMINLSRLKEAYVSVRPPTGEHLREVMEALFRRVPVGCKMIVLLDHDQTRLGDGTLQDLSVVTTYNAAIRAVVAGYPFVELLSYSNFIEDEAEILVGGNHYDRMVFYRLAQAARETILAMPGKDALRPVVDEMAAE
jgi:FkbH-like protein